MVRLVFRPYTQIRRTICTSVSLRASTRVSPGFTLFRHRSPSFGSQQICSYSNLSQANDRSIVPPTRGQDSYLSRRNDLHFHCASGFSTQILAYMLDSLVRVSRRVDEHHFVSIATTPTNRPHPVPNCRTGRTLFSHALGSAGARGCVPRKAGVSFLGQTDRMTLGLKGCRNTLPPPRLSPTSLTDADSLQATGPPGRRPTYEHNTRNVTRPSFATQK
jgi:hypothetical protein